MCEQRVRQSIVENCSVDLVIAAEDPRGDDVGALVERHLEFARELTPPEDVHAMDVDSLVDPAITVFGARLDGVVVGVGALRRLDDSHVELKSMHTGESVRGRGIGRAMLEHLLEVASSSGYERVSLETGTMPAFEPARRLYASAGFEPCDPFGEHVARPNSTFMTLRLEDGTAGRPPSET